MSEIKITVEVPGLPEALNALASAIRGWTEAVALVPIKVEDACEAVDAAYAPERPTVQKDTPSAPASEAAAAAAPNGPAQTSSPSEVKKYTLDDLSNAGAALIDAGKMPQLLDLLARYGVQALTQLDPSTYPAVATELIALGAKL